MTEPEISAEVLRAAGDARIKRAMAAIERAQNELAAACSELSALEGGIPVWRTCNKLTDRVHAHWYRVKDFRDRGRWKLDSTHVEALRRQLMGK